MGSATAELHESKPSSLARRRSHQSSASTVMTESGDTSTTASVVTVSPASTRAHQSNNNNLQLVDDDHHHHLHHHHHDHHDAAMYDSSLPLSLEGPWLRTSSAVTTTLESQALTAPHIPDIAGSAPSSSSVMMSKHSNNHNSNIDNNNNQSESKLELHEETKRPATTLATPATTTATVTTATLRDAPPPSVSSSRSRHAFSSRSNRSGRSANSAALLRAPLASTSSVVDRRLIDKYETVNAEIERVIRATNADPNGGGDSNDKQLLKQVRSELRKAKRNSSQIIHSQRELLEKMERQERGGLRRMFSINREHKMEKLRNKLCEKLTQSVAVDEQLDRLERQSISLTRMSFSSMMGGASALDHDDQLSELEREREDILANLISSAGLTDAQELQSRLAMFSSEKRACECAMKQVEQCETMYRKALHLLRVALSTILSPTYSGSLKEFVLGPYPLAVEAAQLVDQSCRQIQPESRRRYSSYTPELSNVRPPKFPQPMIDFAKRGTRCNFDPSNSAAIEAMRKLHMSENITILLQRIVIAKLELIEKWKRDVERDMENADDGYRKVDTRLQEHLVRITRSVSAA